MCYKSRMKKIIYLFLIMISLPLYAASDSELGKIQSDIRTAESRQRALEKQSSELAKSMNKTKSELVTSAKKMKGLESEKSQLDTKLSKLTNERDRLRAKLGAHQSEMSFAVASLLHMSHTPGSIALTAHASEMDDTVHASELLRTMSEQFSNQITEYEKQLAELNSVQKQIGTEREKLGKTMVKYKSQQSDLEKLMSDRRKQNKSLLSEQQELQKKLRALAERAKSLTDLVEATPKAKTYRPPSGGGATMDSPVLGMLLRGWRDKSALGLISDGWYIRTPNNATVTAPADATVAFADHFKGYNKILILDHHNGYYSVLTGLEILDVMVGQSVLGGEPIARMGPTNPELYLELRYKNQAIDPATRYRQPRGR